MAQKILDGTLSKADYQYSKDYPGQGGKIFFNTYQVYERTIDQSGNIDSGTLKTYQLVLKNGEWYKAAELGVDGKWKALTQKESGILVPNPDITKPGTFEPIPNASDTNILGNVVIADLNGAGQTSLRFQAIQNSKKLLKKSGGLSDQQIDTEYQTSNNLQGPAAIPASPLIPNLLGPPVSPTSPTNQPNPNRPDPVDTTVDITTISQINPDKKNPAFQDLVYPTGIRSNGQDFIKFTVIKYIPRKLNTSATNNRNGAIGVLENRRDASNANLKKDQEIEVKGSIILPIQPSISDSNNVDWNGLGINPLEMELTRGSLNIMSGSGQQYLYGSNGNPGLIQKLQQTIDDPNVINAIKLQFAQKAAGVEGLLSRVTGAVVNPNLELLFQGPTLRPFNFTFRLSARDETEADTVRRIIRVFKQYSAVGTASGGLFLTTPNVFNISYHNRGDEKSNHPSLNKIKTCALKSVSVDYTPDGSYMTFNDNYNTMTSYSISLQFQELEPVTTSDYTDTPDQIGY